MTNGGILALWNDCEPGHEDAYEAWYQGEHLAERLSMPGFLRGRRMKSLGASPAYFTYYETATPDVLFSDAYRALLDSPSEMTEKIMRETFRNMSRTVCRVERREGSVYGGVALSIKLSDYRPGEAADEFVGSLAGRPDVARAEIWTAVETSALAATREENLRGGDDRISACVLVETLREDPVHEISALARTGLGVDQAAVGTYRLLCDLQSEAGAS